MKRNDFKILVKIDGNYPFFPWQTVNDHKRHVKWAYIRIEIHGSIIVETSKIYTFTYKIPR